MLSALLAVERRFRGLAYSISTACETSNHCFHAAANHIRHAEVDLMVAGGAEWSVTPVSLGSLIACRALSQRNDQPETASRPWDQDRDGFVRGEGSGVLVMESLEHAMKPSAPIIAEHLVGAINCDSSYNPRADGLVISSCIKSTLENAGVAPEEVIRPLYPFESSRLSDRCVKLTTGFLQSIIGHCLGAAGGLEVIVLIKAITTGWLHPTINQFNPEPFIEFDTVANKKQQHKVNVAISNSLGFGGHNSVVVFSAFKP